MTIFAPFNRSWTGLSGIRPYPRPRSTQRHGPPWAKPPSPNILGATPSGKLRNEAPGKDSSTAEALPEHPRDHHDAWHGRHACWTCSSDRPAREVRAPRNLTNNTIRRENCHFVWMNRTVVHDSCALLPGRIGIMPLRERTYDKVHQPTIAGGLFFVFLFLNFVLLRLFFL